METALQLFIAFLCIGFLLIAIEVFVPGAILGVLGAISLLIAVAFGFSAFGPQGGFLALVLLLIFGGFFLALWIKFFPRTPFGKTLSLQTDGRSFRSAPPELAALQGHAGTAHTSLRPAGIALIDGRRTDVVAESGYIDAGSPVRVIRVEGNRVVVREVRSA